MPRSKQTKNPIELKAIQQALEAGYSLYWEPRFGWWRLYAVTYTFENGNVRARKIFATDDKNQVIHLTNHLVLQKAKIDKIRTENMLRESSY